MVAKIGRRCSTVVALTADHQAEPPIDPPHPAARPAVDVVDAALGQRAGAPDVIAVVGVPAVNDDVAAVHVGRQVVDRRAGDLAGGHHHPGGPRLGQLPDEVGHRCRPGRPLLLQRADGLRVHVEDHAGVAVAHEAANDARTHPAEPDHAQLHRLACRHRRLLCHSGYRALRPCPRWATRSVAGSRPRILTAARPIAIAGLGPHPARVALAGLACRRPCSSAPRCPLPRPSPDDPPPRCCGPRFPPGRSRTSS